MISDRCACVRYSFAVVCLFLSLPYLNAQKSRDKKTENLTTIQFAAPFHDFGTVVEGQKVSQTFAFTNTGEQALVIKEVRTTCGCTVPEYPKEAVLPGESGEINVTFNTGGKRGQQLKLIRVMANTDPSETVLQLAGEVKVKKKKNKSKG
jgi:hypothetical protein